MDIPPENDDSFYDDLDAPQPFWTRRRLVLTVIVLLIVITFLAFTFQGLFLPPRPPPTLAPGSLI